MRQLNDRDFCSFITARPVVVIHIDAAWDLYRDQVRAKMRDAEADLHEFAAFAEVDCDSEHDLCIALQAANVPCVMYFREGKRVEIVVGADQNVIGKTEALLNRRR
jgi:thioredoxin-like negative regulator of GroEL